MGIRSFIANSALVTGLRSAASESELFAGVEKPSTTLVKMLIAEMIQNVETARSESVSSYISGVRTYRWYFPSFSFEFSQKREDWPYQIKERLGMSGFQLNADRHFTPDSREIQLIELAFHSWLPLRKSFKANETESKRQAKAVDLIEQLFKPKPQPVSETPKPMAPVDLSMLEAPKTRGL